MPPLSHTPHLILASSSSYRQQLLQRLQLPFTAIAPDIDETPASGETPDATALRLAQQKAAAISAIYSESLVIGCDQVATLDGRQIGKPGHHAAALAQLQLMRGRSVTFHSALCLMDGRSHRPGPAMQLENVQVLVKFRDLPDAELDAYLRIEQPYDCAGSAKNEGLGIAILESIHSNDPSALTGLPLIALCNMLRQAGMPFFTLPSPPSCPAHSI